MRVLVVSTATVMATSEVNKAVVALIATVCQPVRPAAISTLGGTLSDGGVRSQSRRGIRSARRPASVGEAMGLACVAIHLARARFAPPAHAAWKRAIAPPADNAGRQT